MSYLQCIIQKLIWLQNVLFHEISFLRLLGCGRSIYLYSRPVQGGEMELWVFWGKSTNERLNFKVPVICGCTNNFSHRERFVLGL